MTREFDALAACGALVSSPFINKVRSFFMLKGRKDYGRIVRAPLALVIGLQQNASPLV